MEVDSTKFQSCSIESEYWKERSITCSNQLASFTDQRDDSLQPTGRILISVIRRVEDARETDICIGSTTKIGGASLFKKILPLYKS